LYFLENKKQMLYNISINNELNILDDDSDDDSDDNSDDDLDNATNIEPYVKDNKLTFNGIMKINNFITTENGFTCKEEVMVERLSTNILKQAIIGIEQIVLEERGKSGFPWKYY